MVTYWAYGGPMVGLVLLFFSLVCFQVDPQEKRRNAQLVAKKTTRIADAASGQLIELKGRAVVDPHAAPLLAPFTQRPVLWHHFRVEVRFGSGKDATWVHLFGSEMSRPFFLDDGSGEQARIALDGDGTLEVDVPLARVARLAKGEPIPPSVRAYVDAIEAHLPDEPLTFHEAVVCEGDSLLVLGRSTRERLVSDVDYRHEATQLVLSRGKQENDALFVTRTFEEARVREERMYLAGGLALLVLGLASLGSSGYCIYLLAIAP